MPMHREDIKAAIRKKHGSLSEFERARGLPSRSVEDVLRGRAVRRAAEAVAAELKTSLNHLFPGRFPTLSAIADSEQEITGSQSLNSAVR